MAKKIKWTRGDLVRTFEILLEHSHTITSDPIFRKMLSRNENLFANQVTREANGNIAYRSVDFDCLDLSDEDFWTRMDDTKYRELIEDNAAVALLKMAEKLKLLEAEQE